MADNPYLSVPANGFWKSAVADKSLAEIDLDWQPKFRIDPSMKIATFGSCFAQHFGRALQQRNMAWFDAEPSHQLIGDQVARAYGYRTFSARTANIYTTSLLKQWTEWALGISTPPNEVWQQDDRFLDPFRPTLEPGGFEDPKELTRLRQVTIEAFRRCIAKSQVFVFTLGLTESWFHAKDGYEYPMCPGTTGGAFDPNQHQFRNQSFAAVRAALVDAIDLMRGVNPGLKVLLTVSPVPLTATMSGQHVVTATMESKSILRAVAGDIARDDPLVDYFPSYEIISSPAFRGAFFESNQRTVAAEGVDFVMQTFFGALQRKFDLSLDLPGPSAPSAADLQCEEAALAAFRPKS